MVIIDVEFLKTLEKRELMSAYGEIIKHAIIFDKKYFHMLTRCNKIDDKKMLLKTIFHSLKIKTYIVEKDFKEQNIRKLLNFGHTIGHAIEALSLQTQTPLLHGEAVIIGMIIETKIAVKIGFCLQQEYEKIKNLIKKYGFEELIGKKFEFSLKDVMKLIKKDKKNQNGEIKMVLPTKIGKCKYDIFVKPEIIESCLIEILK